MNSLITRIVFCFCLIALPFTLTYAKAGCCSHHGGVSGCSAATNKLLCKDGTVSASCPCSGSVAKPAKKTTMTPASTSNKATVPSKTTTPSKTTVPNKATAPAKAPASSAIPAKQKGCCARHGGVAQCNKATGFQMCKDGTTSATCKCN